MTKLKKVGRFLKIVGTEIFIVVTSITLWIVTPITILVGTSYGIHKHFGISGPDAAAAAITLLMGTVFCCFLVVIFAMWLQDCWRNA